MRIGPGNGVGLKIWQCYDNLQAQQWYYTDDQRIVLNGTGLSVPPPLSRDSSFPSYVTAFAAQCVDLPNGVEVDGNQIQTWQCSDGNTNQIWTQARFVAIVGVCSILNSFFSFLFLPLLFVLSTSTHMINRYLRNTAAHRQVLEV